MRDIDDTKNQVIFFVLLIIIVGLFIALSVKSRQLNNLKMEMKVYKGEIGATEFFEYLDEQAEQNKIDQAEYPY